MRIGIIDDSEQRVRALKEAAEQAGLSGSLENSLLAPWETEESLARAVAALASVQEDVLFWLDLKLHSGSTPWTWIEEFKAAEPTTAQNFVEYVDGLAAATKLSESANPQRRLLFACASGVSRNGEAARFLNDKFRGARERQVRAVAANADARSDNVAFVARELGQIVLRDWFSDVSERLVGDPTLSKIAGLLVAHSETTDTAGNGRTFWSHPELLPGAESVTALSGCLGVTRDPTNVVKALMQCGTSEPGWQELFADFQAVFINSEKPLCHDDLKAVLEKLDITGLVELSGTAFLLPAQPGLPFLLSLRSFLRVAEYEEGAAVKTCVWEGTDHGGMVTLGLHSKRIIDGREHPASVSELRRKFEASKGDARTLAGLREALFELTYGTVKELRGEGGILALFSWRPNRAPIVGLDWDEDSNALRLTWPV